jgi:hypothetical protein
MFRGAAARWRAGASRGKNVMAITGETERLDLALGYRAGRILWLIVS